VELALRESVPANAARLVLDLTHVGFLDSSAVQMLFELHRDMERARGQLVLAMSPESAARRSIELSDPTGVLLLHPSSESALGSLRS
jgi:anti-anti-sigma factor